MARHSLVTVGDEFFDEAPVRATLGFDTPAAPARVWEVLAADDAVGSWSKLVTGAHWEPGPRGVGAIREVTLGGFLTVREEFYRWDEGERMTFSAVETTGPGIRSFAEDYVITPKGNGSRLEWTVATAPKAGVGPRVGGVAGRVLWASVWPLAHGLEKKLKG
uniref:SRPBCC family protein n=1 Tax=Gordonia sp. B7-2 TaxID=3420932 RepID=UPI003D8E6D1D